MLGSEINESNKKMAEENVKKNSLEHLITSKRNFRIDVLKYIINVVY